MRNLDTVLALLPQSPGPLDELVTLISDDLGRRPLHELVEPEWLAGAMVEGLRSMAQDDRLEGWVQSRVADGIAAAEELEGPLRPRIPPQVVTAVKELAGRPFKPSPVLVRAVLDQQAVRELIREMLQGAVLDFGRSLLAMMPDPAKLPGGRSLTSLMGMAKGMASAFGSGFDLERKARTFADQAIHKAIDLWVERITSDRFAEDLARWRLEMIDTLLDTPAERYVNELRKLNPENVAAQTTEILRGASEWEGLHDGLLALFTRAVELYGDQSLRRVLEGSGLEETWRPHLDTILLERMRAFVVTPGFGHWVRDVIRG